MLDGARHHRPADARAARGTAIGYLPQEPSIFRKLTVEENILAIVETPDTPRRERAARVAAQLAELHLGHVAKQKAYTLSGGERRRLEIARALVTQPKFLLMDEPFAAIDPISVAEVQKIILQLKARGIGVVVTDHNVRETLRIVDRAYLIHKGKVLDRGPRRLPHSTIRRHGSSTSARISIFEAAHARRASGPRAEVFSLYSPVRDRY
jgi:lipopolysaccharide export system ATP-binding protein